jgi:hypothetical protein
VKTNLLDVVGEVRRYLEQNGRVSLRMLRRQFGQACPSLFLDFIPKFS